MVREHTRTAFDVVSRNDVPPLGQPAIHDVYMYASHTPNTAIALAQVLAGEVVGITIATVVRV